jgi:hypothetical protein
MQGQPAAGFAQLITFACQPRLQVIPSIRVGQTIAKKRPQGRDEPLIRSPSCLRATAAVQVAFDGIADQVADRRILVTGKLPQGSDHFRGHKDRCGFHPADMP